MKTNAQTMSDGEDAAREVAHEARTEYFTPDASDLSFGLCVTTVGCQVVLPDMDYPLDGHPQKYHFSTTHGRILGEYQLVYITHGRGIAFFDFDEDGRIPDARASEDGQSERDALSIGESLSERGDLSKGGALSKGDDVEQGSLIWLLPGDRHAYHPVRRVGWTEYYIGFKGEIADRLVRNAFMNSRSSVIDFGLSQELVTLYIHALDYARSGKLGLQQYLSGIVLHMLGVVISSLKERMSEEAGILEQAKVYILEHLCEDVDIKYLAKKLGRSYSWIRRAFKEKEGLSPARYIVKMRIKRAQAMLLSTPLMAKEIAYDLGFNSPTNFNSAFKKYVGCTPAEFRLRCSGRDVDGEG